MPRIVYVSCSAAFALGMFFTFVWAPHPWGWAGFDQYHDLALALARGVAFPTMEVPWGYAYFLAAFYRLFGDHPWIPLVAQVSLNATIPALVYAFARTWLGTRTASVAALLAGVLSFNTVYASTQSSDAVCTWLFMAAIVSFAAALRRDDVRWFVLAGLLTGAAPQFRPNLILVPVVLAAFVLYERRSQRALGHAAALVTAAVLVLVPWVVRNYRLTRSVIPTSVHGGVQLWYGTLQTGPYLNSRSDNPRSAFASPSFDYTSLADVPPIVSAAFVTCSSGQPSEAVLRYWTDKDSTERSIAPASVQGRTHVFEIPPPHGEAVIYYYFQTRWAGNSEALVPPDGAHRPLVYFVSDRHLGDLDVHGDLLDAFDVIRLVRTAAWNEPLTFAAQLHAAGVDDVRTAITRLAEPRVGLDAAARLERNLEHDDREARLTYADGSTLVVPREWHEHITDVGLTEGTATALLTASRSLAELTNIRAGSVKGANRCDAHVEDLTVNEVFYRREPHMQRRYSALAYDNIRRDPIGFGMATAYRAVRLFVIAGTEDSRAAQQFARSRLVYAAATVASVGYALLFVAGVVLAWRRHLDFRLPLLLVLYIPATLAPVLTNMRYTVTMQPLVFMFIAVAVNPFSRSLCPPDAAGALAGLHRGETGRARRL
jgi:hypothetical protein